eukprot:10760872-Karenia_brevis.AAC.1
MDPHIVASKVPSPIPLNPKSRTDNLIVRAVHGTQKIWLQVMGFNCPEHARSDRASSKFYLVLPRNGCGSDLLANSSISISAFLYSSSCLIIIVAVSSEDVFQD